MVSLLLELSITFSIQHSSYLKSSRETVDGAQVFEPHRTGSDFRCWSKECWWPPTRQSQRPHLLLYLLLAPASFIMSAVPLDHMGLFSVIKSLSEPIPFVWDSETT